jgi:DNA end-binding protein Ku
MARAIWTGSLSFGLVNVPVGLFSATEDRSIRFNQLRASTSERVRNKRVGDRTGEEVSLEEIVKGYDVGGGEYVVITPEELASVAPGPSRTIEVTDFVNLADIDPIYFEKPYYLAPQGKNGDRAYGLLLHAMEETSKVAVANFVMREKQYLVAVRPGDGVLILETLLYYDEVRDPVKEIPSLPVEATFEEREVDMAKLLIESMSVDWDAERYEDTYRERVEELIDRKRSGAVVVTEEPQPAPAPVVDLFAALQASVSAARGKESGSSKAEEKEAPVLAATGTTSAGGSRKRAAGSDEESPASARSRRKPAGGEDEEKEAAPAPAKTRGRKAS